MWLFKKNKSKKRKYVVKLTDYEALKLTNAITESILMTLRDIDDLKGEYDEVVLYDLLNTKYALMRVMKSFGSTIYDDELKARKTIDREMKKFKEELEEKKTSSTTEIVDVVSVEKEIKAEDEPL